jgi:hypothetical protein
LLSAASIDYQIIGIGEAAVPLILKELSERPTVHWFWALNAITNEDPTEPGQNVEHAVESWLQWGRRHQYI